MITLKKPSLSEKEIYSAAQKIMAAENFDFAFDLDKFKSFNEYLKRNQELEAGINLGQMVQAVFFGIYNKNDELVGRVSIRYFLNDFLMKIGGHIGYCILPQHRRRGYASEACKKGLEYLKDQRRLEKALITCSPDNYGSIKTIEKNGGVFENQINYQGIIKNRYWVTLRN